MSVFNVGGAMAIIGVEMEEGLEEEAGSDTAVGGAPKLAGGFEAAAVLFVKEGGLEVSDEAAENFVFAEGADAFDFVDGEGVAVGVRGLEEFALARDDLGAEAVTVGFGDAAFGDEAEPVTEDAMRVGAGGEEDDGKA